MRLFVFNCLLLASVAVALPNGPYKRDLSYLKNLITSAIFGQRRINIQPTPVLQAENGHRLFRLPGYDDVMIKAEPKKPMVKEFVYPPAVKKVNLNAFGTVVGTKSNDDTLVAVKEVDNLLSTDILYGGHNNVMKETVVHMFPSLYTTNYVKEEKIMTAPVIKTEPVLKELIESRPVLTEVVESRPILTEVVESRPVLMEVVESRPVLTEVVESRPVLTNVVESRPVLTEVVESRPVLTNVVESRPVLTEVVESRPVLTEAVESSPVLTEVVKSRPVLTEVVESRPVLTNVVESRPVLTEVVESRPVLTNVVESRPVLTEVVESRPVLTEAVESSPVLTEVVKSRPVLMEVVENRPVLTEVVESRPVLTNVVESRQLLTEAVENRPVLTEVDESSPVLTNVVESRPVLTELVESRPVLTEAVESRVLTEAVESRPVLSEVVESRPVLTEVVESRPVLTEVVESRPVLTEVVESRPVLTEVVESRPVLTEAVESRPVLTEVVESRPILTEAVESRPVLTKAVETRPVLTEVTRPVEEKVELKMPIERIYLYKQMQNNEPVMTYMVHNNPGVEVVESIKTKTELPMFIKKRADEAIVPDTIADPNRFASVQEVFQYQSPPVVDFSYPRVEANSYLHNSFREEIAPVPQVLQYQSHPVYDFSYPEIETNSYAQNSFHEEVLAEGFGTVADFGHPPQSLRSLKYSPVRYNSRPTKTKPINPRPLPLHRHKSLHFEEDISASKDKVNSPTRKIQIFNNLGEKVDLSQTLGPIPPQYITNVGKKGRNSAVSNGNIKKMKAVPIVGSKDNVSNAKIPINVYRVQNNPNTGKVLKGSDALRTNVNTKRIQYVNTPAVNRGTTKKDTAPVQNFVFTNKITGNPQSATRSVVVASTNAPKQPLRENVQTSIVHKPTVVKENKYYFYQQKDADGSSLNVNGNKHGVAVIDMENNNRGRGDIPEQ